MFLYPFGILIMYYVKISLGLHLCWNIFSLFFKFVCRRKARLTRYCGHMKKQLKEVVKALSI